MNAPFVHRDFTVAATGQSVTAELGCPINLPDSPDFICTYRITGVEPPITGEAYGVDSLMALVAGVRLLDTELGLLLKRTPLNWFGEPYSESGLLHWGV